jgi:DNA-binding transcriptional MerR regulator
VEGTSKVNGKVDRPLRPVDLGRMVGISPSLVRTYESVGFLPPAERSATGYRRYTAAHGEALRVARCLIAGYGWQPALAVMRSVHARNLDEALALVDARHADLHRQREQINEVLQALEQTTLLTTGNHPTMGRRRILRIGAAAELVRVRPSALRFWEQQGLLQPVRDAGTRSRWFDHEQIQRAHTVALLRAAGYRFEAIRVVLDEVAANRTEQARAALEERRRSVERASRQAMDATSTLHRYLQVQSL